MVAGVYDNFNLFQRMDSALIRAAEKNHTDCVRLLVAAGAELKAKKIYVRDLLFFGVCSRLLIFLPN